MRSFTKAIRYARSRWQGLTRFPQAGCPALDVEKQPAAPHLGRGLVYSQLGEFNLAVGDFTEAIQA
uniref:tetratricopeptide repeat protein n=1 Tax=Enterobacter hormaechei TaxID=158836 RepID=UPI001954055A